MRSPVSERPKRTLVRIGPLILASFLLGACQMGPGELFIITNQSDETVVVTRNGNVYATLPPGRGNETALVGDCPDGPSSGDRFSATSASGRHYDYEGPVCNGREWRIGTASRPPVFPSPT
ncbi:hypothetical protein AB0395_41980 [Streptosporangium sp. NPDC051023]|uniref:hypothetical protein n=1 Tax=Streptosporangium sp. NPDC051023 TaxID=3155410 RepID=UPI00344C6B22